MIDYTLIAGLLLYFVVIKLTASTNIRPLTSSVIVVLGYFAIITGTKAIILSAYDAPLWQLFGIVPIATLILQFIVAFITFLKIDQDADSLSSPIIWGAFGCIGIFFIVPAIVSSALGGL